MVRRPRFHHWHRLFALLSNGRAGLACALCLLTALLLAFEPAYAKSSRSKSAQLEEGASEVEVEKGAGSGRRQRQISLNFRQMGAWSSIRLRGVDGTQDLVFPIRPDELVVGAKLRIGYDYSPALLPDLSHLQVVLNDRMAAVISLPRDKPVGNARDIVLDPRLFRENNVLQFRLIGHYTHQCEDPYHTALWLVLSDLGRLELTLASVSQSSDLKKLPTPFFDRRENGQLSVPFVFAKSPSFSTLQAAGVAASWFGLQAKGRGVQFPVSVGELPDGHAVVFLQGSENVAGFKAGVQSSLTLVQHPTNPHARLLLVTGSDDAELARAAHALALGAHALAGRSVNVTKEEPAAPRKPYDAPFWLPTDRPVRLGEIMPADQMRVHAYYPDAIRLNYRISPDTFTWRSEGIPLNLKFRATRLPWHHNSSLNIGMNSNFVQAFSLNEPLLAGATSTQNDLGRTDGPGIRQELVRIPPYPLQGRDQLQLTYAFDVLRQGECMAMPPDNLEGAIDPQSTIDFSSFPHYAALPNLSYFANLGFPYTRLADLSDTAVVLSSKPNAHEMGLYLTLMGRMGESTGYPVLRHTLASDVGLDKVAGKDLIIIESGMDQTLMSKWKDALPMVVVDGERRLREPRGFMRLRYDWAQEDLLYKPTPPGSLSMSGGGLAAIMGFESPLKSGRSAVFFYADKAEDLRKIGDAITDFDRLPSIQGDFVVIDDKSIQHARSGDTYYSGSLPWLSRLRWFLAEQPMVFGLLAMIVVLALGVLAYRPLRRLVERRFPAKP